MAVTASDAFKGRPRTWGLAKSPPIAIAFYIATLELAFERYTRRSYATQRFGEHKRE